MKKTLITRTVLILFASIPITLRRFLFQSVLMLLYHLSQKHRAITLHNLMCAFPEKGLYMLATILKSQQAVQATLAIIETFSKMRKLTRNIKTLSNVKDMQA